MRAVLLASAVCVALACAGPAAAAPVPATFRVGAAVESTDPTVQVYAGGFGLSPAITQVHDPLQVRAIYISNGKHAVAIAVLDAQAMFAAYQERGDLGITSARELAAAAASRHGPNMGAGDIIVQSTHTHAGPTLEGISGPCRPCT